MAFEPNERDKVVTFDEKEHKYYVQGKQMKYSVTQLIHLYFSDFDATTIATNMLKRRDFFQQDKYSKYWDLARDKSFEQGVEAIIKSWDTNRDESSFLGTAMHQSIEDFILTAQELPHTIESEYFQDFHADMTTWGFVPYKPEQIVWDQEYNLAGSADMMYTRPEWLDYTPLKVFLIDWKRSKEIKMSSFRGKKGLGVCSNLEDCNYVHYTLQLNLYKHLLEKHYNVQVVKMAIAVFHPDNENQSYIMYLVGNKTKTAKRICLRKQLPKET